MRKYLFGVCAIALAISFSAFKSDKTSVVFVYTGPTTNLESNMEDPSNWEVSGTSPFFDCGSGSDVSCSFEAGESYAVNGRLDPNAVIELETSPGLQGTIPWIRIARILIYALEISILIHEIANAE